MGQARQTPAGLIRKFKRQALTGDDGQRIWLAVIDKHKYESGEILCMSMSQFINLKLEDGEGTNTLVFEADNHREEI